MVTVARYICDRLWAAGVRRIYGLPGGENVELLDAMRERGFGFVLAKNESSACFMAASEARLTGGIGVAMTTLGPGAANATAGLAHAWLDRAPILLITAAGDPSLRHRHTHQALNLQSLFAPISKLSAELSAGSTAEMINRALALTRHGRPGPVHLGIHNTVSRHTIDAEDSPSPAAVSAARTRFDARACVSLLADKRRPVIVCGLGLEPERPYDELRELAEALGAPVIDTPKSKGALCPSHPLFAGTIGLTVADPAYALLNESDCIIALGFDVVELVKPWDQPQPLVWIGKWENDDPPIPSVMDIVGPMREVLGEVSRLLPRRHSSWGARRVQAFRRRLQSRALPTPRAGSVLPQTLLRVLSEVATEQVIITTDVGSHKILAALEWPARRPNLYLVSNGLSAMGFGLTSAIAAALSTGQPAVCITGDAGLAMVMGELGLLKALNLPVMVVVMNDSALDLIRSAQQRRGHPAFGTEFDNPDFALIAAAYGLAYHRVESESDCAAALAAGLKSGAPTLVDVMIDPAAYPTSVKPR